MNLEELEGAVFARIEAELKPFLGDLWQEYKGDAAEWAKIVAKLEYDIAMGNHPVANAITYEHVTKIGIPCFAQRIRVKAEDHVLTFVKSLLQFILDSAVAAGMAYLEKRAKA